MSDSQKIELFNVKLVNVKCFVGEFYMSSVEFKCSRENTLDNQRHLSSSFVVEKEKAKSSSAKLENAIDNLIPKSSLIPKKRSPNKKIKQRYKKSSPKNPEKFKIFLEKMKSRPRKPETSGKSIAISKADKDQKIS